MESYKISSIVLGDSGSGKSSLLNKFMSDTYSPDTCTPTIGVDFFMRRLLSYHNTINIKIQLWDTAGLERFRSITEQYVRNVSVVYIVYDVTNYESFLNVRDKWIPLVLQKTSNLTRVVLIANKCDDITQHRHIVSRSDGETLAMQYNCSFFETSIYHTTIDFVFINPIHDIVFDIVQNRIDISDYDTLGIVRQKTRPFDIESQKTSHNMVSCCIIS